MQLCNSISSFWTSWVELLVPRDSNMIEIQIMILYKGAKSVLFDVKCVEKGGVIFCYLSSKSSISGCSKNYSTLLVRLLPKHTATVCYTWIRPDTPTTTTPPHNIHFLITLIIQSCATTWGRLWDLLLLFQYYY